MKKKGRWSIHMKLQREGAGARRWTERQEIPKGRAEPRISEYEGRTASEGKSDGGGGAGATVQLRKELPQWEPPGAEAWAGGRQPLQH